LLHFGSDSNAFGNFSDHFYHREDPRDIDGDSSGSEGIRTRILHFGMLLGGSALVILVFYIYHEEIHTLIKKLKEERRKFGGSMTPARKEDKRGKWSSDLVLDLYSNLLAEIWELYRP